MTSTKKSTINKKKKEFFTEGQLTANPLIEAQNKVGGEFIDLDNDYRGQTVEVKSDTHLEKDTGYGEEIMLRTFEFGVNPQAFKEYKAKSGGLPTAQEIFDSHGKGILALLWQDGLAPAEEIAPRIVFSKNKKTYLIMVGARAMTGQVFLDKPKTLTEILSETRNN